MTFDWKEVVGIIATIFVLASFTQSNVQKLRIINSVGSALFIVYGILIGSWSVWILNASLFVLQIYQIHKDNIKENKK